MTLDPRATAALAAALAAGLALAAPAAQAGETTAQQACLYQFQRSGEPNTGPGGRIVRSHRAGGAWEITIIDAAEAPWECRADDQGYVEYLRKDPAGRAGLLREERREERQEERRREERAEAGDDRWGEDTREARQACRAAVRERSGRGGLSFRRIEPRKGETLVVIDDDGEKGSWRCVVTNRGKVSELKFSRD
ncbi:hypothetical protein [Albimonas pacifica]|uniref:Peptidase propeptide and YPEB domain-containing protein n=1 Tax=Albimonas pacifica TaxID=1114924 RepID=A0A1I3EJC5_9RHOB|nr:hypothetical protein [Albimonas pacifica]SFH98821.1 hypothetical protein SAMN05216258_103403 [Albimonas pacifica]